MKFLILADNNVGMNHYLQYRTMGPGEVSRRLNEKNITNTIIDWFNSWNKEDLQLAIQEWFKGEEEPVIALSCWNYPSIIDPLIETLEWAKSNIKNLKIIFGGTKTVDPRSNIVNIADLIFLGRSMEIFDAWLNGHSIDQYRHPVYTNIVVNKSSKIINEEPVILKLNKCSFYDVSDVVGFEISLGCRFNCSFCNFEHRGNKEPKNANAQRLIDFFNDAKDNGLEYFYSADDTLNETDEKLEILANAISAVEFKPKITAYLRLDMISSRPSQLEILKRINPHSIFFGIESFNPEASKAIRKNSTLSRNIETLRLLREALPDTFLHGSMIVGLTGDSEDHIWASMRTVINEQLLDSLSYKRLGIFAPTNYPVVSDYMSDISANPEKYGYTITGKMEGGEYSWSNHWTDNEKSTKLSDRLNNYLDTIPVISGMSSFEYTAQCALGVFKNRHDVKTVPYLRSRQMSAFESKKRRRQYIKKKLKFITEQ